MHRLLKRQLERRLSRMDKPPEGWDSFIAAVDEAYCQADTDRQRMERALELSSAELMVAKESAEKASQTKSAFLANMSHELRTPLNSVIGFANILLKNKAKNLRDNDISFLERILSNGKHLLALINTILDLSKVEAGGMELVLTSVHVETLVKETLEQMEGQVKDRSISLIADIPKTVAPLQTDAEKLKQVIINLVANALKFTEQGSVTVRVVTDAQSHPVRIEVVDTGIGISKDKQSLIFEAFQQADNTMTRMFGGTGLGLTISRSFCELMGYGIEVDSELGKGATFRVLLNDVGRSAPRREEAKPGSLSRSPTEKRLALVVDDESDSRIILTRHLEDAGYQVIAANSGEQGIRMAKEFKPSLITLDLMMPGKNGWDVLRELKATADLRDIPVVIVSIVARENRASIIGAVDVLHKPINREELRRVVERNLKPPSRKVLVIDDNSDARTILMNAIEQDGLDANGAENGQVALGLLESFRPDLIILDIMMPVMDGMTFLAALRRNPKFARVPVVIVTAKDLSEAELRVLQSSTMAVIKKGHEQEDRLRGILRSLFQAESEAAS